jgi:NADPH2:quinone reductase
LIQNKIVKFLIIFSLDATGDYGRRVETACSGRRLGYFRLAARRARGINGEQLVSLLFNSQTIRGYPLYEVLSEPPLIAAALQEIFGWLASGRLHVEVKDRFPLAKAKEAHEAMEARRTIGKVVLEP